jgi:hypothetical protein
MLSGLADDEAADEPSADADEVAAGEAAAPVLLLPVLLLQAAAARARTLSPAAAIARFMVRYLRCSGRTARRAAKPAGDRARAEPGLG